MGKSESGTLSAVRSQSSRMPDPAYNVKDQIYKNWGIIVKNGFADCFVTHEIPKQNGVEVPQDLVEAYMAQTMELVTKILSAVSKFEKSCADCLSNMLLHIQISDLADTLSMSIRFVSKTEMYFIVLDEFHEPLCDRERIGKLVTTPM